MIGIIQLSTRLRQVSSRCQVPSSQLHHCGFLVTTRSPIWNAHFRGNHDAQRAVMDVRTWQWTNIRNLTKGEKVDILQHKVFLLINQADTSSRQEPSHFPDERTKKDVPRWSATAHTSFAPGASVRKRPPLVRYPWHGSRRHWGQRLWRIPIPFLHANWLCGRGQWGRYWARGRPLWRGVWGLWIGAVTIWERAW